jgi:hypothetical protein
MKFLRNVEECTKLDKLKSRDIRKEVNVYLIIGKRVTIEENGQIISTEWKVTDSHKKV